MGVMGNELSNESVLSAKHVRLAFLVLKRFREGAW